MVVKLACSAIGVLTAAALAGAAYGDPVNVPLNQQSDVNGVTVGCTGIGQSRHNAEWNAFPVRVDFAKPNGHLLADVAVTLSRAGGDTMLEAGCGGPVVLFKLPPGRYQVQGRLTGTPNAKPQTATFSAPASGQTRVVLRFPDA